MKASKFSKVFYCWHRFGCIFLIDIKSVHKYTLFILLKRKRTICRSQFYEPLSAMNPQLKKQCSNCYDHHKPGKDNSKKHFFNVGTSHRCSFFLLFPLQSYFDKTQSSFVYILNKPPACFLIPTWSPLQLARLPFSIELGNLVNAGQSCYRWAILILISLGNLDLAGQSCSRGNHKASKILKLRWSQSQIFDDSKALFLRKMCV